MVNIERVNAEVLAVLKALGNEYLLKIPSDLANYLINNSDKNLKVNIDVNKPIQDQNISKEARSFLTLIKLQYFCETDDERNKLIEIINKNQKT